MSWTGDFAANNLFEHPCVAARAGTAWHRRHRTIVVTPRRGGDGRSPRLLLLPPPSSLLAQLRAALRARALILGATACCLSPRARCVRFVVGLDADVAERSKLFTVCKEYQARRRARVFMYFPRLRVFLDFPRLRGFISFRTPAAPVGESALCVAC